MRLNLFLFWLRLWKPQVYYRLTRLWTYQFLNLITSIDPFDTPFVSMLPKVRAAHTLHEWVTDELDPP